MCVLIFGFEDSRQEEFPKFSIFLIFSWNCYNHVSILELWKIFKILLWNSWEGKVFFQRLSTAPRRRIGGDGSMNAPDSISRWWHIPYVFRGLNLADLQLFPKSFRICWKLHIIAFPFLYWRWFPFQTFIFLGGCSITRNHFPNSRLIAITLVTFCTKCWFTPCFIQRCEKFLQRPETFRREILSTCSTRFDSLKTIDGEV